MFFLAGTGLVSIITLRLYKGMPSFFSFAMRVVYFVSSRSFPTFRSSSLLEGISCSSWPHLQLRHIFLKFMETATKLQSHTIWVCSNITRNPNLCFQLRKYTLFLQYVKHLLYVSCCIIYIICRYCYQIDISQLHEYIFNMKLCNFFSCISILIKHIHMHYQSPTNLL